MSLEEPPIRIPLFTGDGFAEDLGFVGVWTAACTVTLAAIPLLATGHWIVAVLVLLVGSFLAAAWWSFPAHAWAQRPADVYIAREGLRVVGGAADGVRLAWADVDPARCAVVQDDGIFMRRLVIASRDGGSVVLARGDELASFTAVLDVLRAYNGLDPLPDGVVAEFDPNALTEARGRGKKRRKQHRPEAMEREQPKPAALRPPEPRPADAPDVVGCPGCGAAVAPADAPAVQCRHCGAACAMPELLRTRLREVSRGAALAARNHRRLRRLLAQPRAGWTQALVLGLAGLPVLLWLLALAIFSALLWRDALDGAAFVGLFAPPLLLGISLPIAAGLYTCRRRAVRVLTLDFAATPPDRAGSPLRCRVCGAPLAAADDGLVVGCAYCRASNIVAVATPRTPIRQERQATTIDDAVGMFQAELLFRVIGFAVFAVPGLVLAWSAVGLLFPAR
ncbi:hypothetical protein [Nannocystis bainbridge]|uniref:Uncharacterized protein n=1 Tax=Nannocystis bainbridge TaxID=2995303 RepID=A0ABT5ECQ3_9BACT|nr:hypothetical protein [Nannocystis bainbridge]MDC0723655.1 hypothetical protein [Nannocystis bainbridge]